MLSIERNCWPLLSKKTIIADGRMHYGHSLSSRVLEGNTCVVGGDIVVWRPMARRCVM
jgi:hypothetical protein